MCFLRNYFRQLHKIITKRPAKTKEKFLYIYALTLYLFIAVIVIIFIASYVLTKNRVNYTFYFLALCLSMVFYIFGYLMELNSTTLNQMVLWSSVQYIGIPYYATFWLIVALLYTKTIKRIKPWLLVLLFLIPITTFVLKLTNSYHFFFYKSVSMEQIAGINFLLLGKGPWYFVQMVYTILILVVINIIFIKEYRKVSINNKYRYQLLITASFLPYLGMIVILIRGIDFTAIISPISALIVGYAIFKYDFLEIKAISKEAIFINNPNGMIITDNDNVIIDFNMAASKFFSLYDVKLSYKSMNEALINDKALLSLFVSDDTKQYMHEGQYYELKFIRMKDKGNKDIGKLFTIVDITEKKEAEEELNRLATIDSLSELYNRRKFMELGVKEFERAKRYGESFCLVMMDLDFFKNINDQYGHAVGDKVIQNLGTLIKDTFRKTDISGRLGGEEFSIILLNTDLKDGYEIAEKFRKLVENNIIETENGKIQITISIGITQYHKSFNKFNEVLGLADKAMYESKAKGRNIVSIKSL